MDVVSSIVSEDVCRFSRSLVWSGPDEPGLLLPITLRYPIKFGEMSRHIGCVYRNELKVLVVSSVDVAVA